MENWTAKESERQISAMSDTNPAQIHATGETTGFFPAPGDKGKPINVIGTNSIRAGFDATCLRQALNARSAPGVTDLVLNPPEPTHTSRRVATHPDARAAHSAPRVLVPACDGAFLFLRPR